MANGAAPGGETVSKAKPTERPGDSPKADMVARRQEKRHSAHRRPSAPTNTGAREADRKRATWRQEGMPETAPRSHERMGPKDPRPSKEPQGPGNSQRRVRGPNSNPPNSSPDVGPTKRMAPTLRGRGAHKPEVDGGKRADNDEPHPPLKSMMSTSMEEALPVHVDAARNCAGETWPGRSGPGPNPPRCP